MLNTIDNDSRSNNEGVNIYGLTTSEGNKVREQSQAHRFTHGREATRDSPSTVNEFSNDAQYVLTYDHKSQQNTQDDCLHSVTRRGNRPADELKLIKTRAYMYLLTEIPDHDSSDHGFRSAAIHSRSLAIKKTSFDSRKLSH